MLRKFDKASEKKLLKTWESLTFRIYLLARKDSRIAVGDHLRLVWRVLNDRELDEGGIQKELRAIGSSMISLQDALEKFRGKDAYPVTLKLCGIFCIATMSHLPNAHV
jgi:hypothetical protein